MGKNLASLQKMVADTNAECPDLTVLEKPDEKGIQWAWMGSNASHEFYLGVDAEDVLWVCSYGPDYGRNMLEKVFRANHPHEALPVELTDHRWSCLDCERGCNTHSQRQVKPGEHLYLGHW